MPITVSQLAKQLEIAPEAVMLHAMEFDLENLEDDSPLSDEVAAEIRKIEQTDEVKQTQYEIEEELDREIIEEQQKQTAGQKKTVRKKKEKTPDTDEEEIKKIIKKDDDGTVILPDAMTVREFSLAISKPIPIVLVKLKQNGIIANLKQEIDYETAAIIAQELGAKVKKEAFQLSGEDLFRADLSRLLQDEESEHLQPRPPVVSIMGHVDHGKTSILDYIRKAKVVDTEAGGITQSIGAYQVQLPDKSLITFLDTPGHEAFTLMRARGAKATDLAILVVAATEGLKPQSIEAINHAKEADIPIIVAINKMDLDGADPDTVKSQLAEHDLTPEDWGGKIPCVPVSAKTGDGIDDLLDTIKITAELQDLKANPHRPAIGTIVECSVHQGSGVMATLLINTGTLKRGDAFVIYNQNGKVRSMKDFSGKELKVADPSTPVQITGISTLPQVGDILQVMKNEKIARKKAEEVGSIHHEDALSKRKKFSLATLKAKLAEGKLDQFKLIVKANTNGALEAVKNEVEKLKTEKTIVKVVHSGVGEISDGDVMLAKAGETIIVGFEVDAPGRIQKMADQEGVDIFTFDVIYHLTEKILDIIEGREDNQEEEKILGRFKIKAIFASNKKMAVLGGDVTEGLIRKSTKFRLLREGTNETTQEKEMQVVGTAKIDTVQLGQQEKNEINEGTECGMKVTHKDLTFQEGDELELFIQKK